MVEQNARRRWRSPTAATCSSAGSNRFTGTGPDLLDDPQVAELYLGGRGAAEADAETDVTLPPGVADG